MKVRLMLLLMLLLPSMAAKASLITIEPDDYAPGTNLTSLSAELGVTLMTFSSFYGTGSFNFSPVYVAEDSTCDPVSGTCDYAVTGQNFFHSNLDGGQPNWGVPQEAAACYPNVGTGLCSQFSVFNAMVMVFHEATDYVEISGTFLSDYPMLVALDSDFNTVGWSGSGHIVRREPQARTNYSTTWIQNDTTNIAYVFAGSWSTWSSLDTLRFNGPSRSVPEPTSLLLLGLGVLGSVAVRRRKAH